MAEQKKKTSTTQKSTTAKKQPAKKTAEKKEPAKKTTTKSSSSSTHISNTSWSLSKISFVVIFAVAVLYLVNSLLAIFGVGLAFITAMQAVCSAMALAIVGIVGWSFVKNRKRNDLKAIYVIALIVVLVGIVIPAVLK